MVGLILRLLIIVILNIMALGIGITQQYGLSLALLISFILLVLSYYVEMISDIIESILDGLNSND